jgi:hypothetical protein
MDSQLERNQLTRSGSSQLGAGAGSNMLPSPKPQSVQPRLNRQKAVLQSKPRMGELRLYYPLQDIVEELGDRPFLISLSAAFQSLSSKLVSLVIWRCRRLALPPDLPGNIS